MENQEHTVSFWNFAFNWQPWQKFLPEKAFLKGNLIRYTSGTEVRRKLKFGEVSSKHAYIGPILFGCCFTLCVSMLSSQYRNNIGPILQTTFKWKRKILLNCFISQFDFIDHSCFHVLIRVLSKSQCHHTILCKNCSILTKQCKITNTEQHWLNID